MEQFEFSKLAEAYVRQHYIGIVGKLTYHEDNSFWCTIESSKKQLSIWIATFDCEITVGFESPSVPNEYHWHTHMSLWGASRLEEELEMMKQLVDSILDDTQVLLFSSIDGYLLPDDLEDNLQNPRANEKITACKWSML